MSIDAILSTSDRRGKKYKVVVMEGKRKKTIHFGADGMSDYTKHHDEARKQRYINRHRKHENFNDPWHASFWALHVLWNLPTINESISDIEKKFDINIKHQ